MEQSVLVPVKTRPKQQPEPVDLSPETRALAKLRQTFACPPVDYRPAPFTVLNDEYEEGQGEMQLTRLLEELTAAGYGGVYLHPRPGLITEYLSPRWFSLIRHCISECKRLGLIPHLYDENSYPSGFAGGHVPAKVPEARSRYVTLKKGKGRIDLPIESLGLYRWTNGRPASPLRSPEVVDDIEWVAFTLADFPPMPWHGDTIYSSLLDPRTAKTFLQTTHDLYYRELGELWKNVPSIFTDEPHLPGSGHGPWSPGLHLTPYVLGQFQQRLGYDLRRHIAELFFNIGNFRKTRYDFYDLCHRLWMENWALPLESWCKDHDIKLTGHYLEHDWPCPYATPGHVHMLAHMDWPGTDMLMGFLLKGHDFYEVQGFDPAPPGCEPHGLLYLRQVHSLANQLAKERIMDEAWGAGGNESAPEDWMRIGRWLIVHGVNLLVPHSSWDTIRGGRKADHPQNFGPQSPWFEYLRPLNDELARLCWITNQGQCLNRVLVIDSLTSAFCAARKADAFEEEVLMNTGFDWSSSHIEASLLSILPLKRQADQFAQDLAEAQIDFDLGDEYVIEEFGQVNDAGLHIGQRSYPLIVLMPGLNHLRSSTLQLLSEHLVSGGRILALSGEEFFLDGVASGALSILQSTFPEQFEWCENTAGLCSKITDIFSPRLSFSGEVPPTGIAHMHRFTDAGEVFYIVNSSDQPLVTEACLSTSKEVVVSLDPRTGNVTKSTCRSTATGLCLPLSIPLGGAAVLLATNAHDEDTPSRAMPNSLLHDHQSAELILAERCSDNVLVIDFCELEVNGTTHSNEAVVAANRRYWQAHGLETYGWNLLIQYRDQIVARDESMHPESGGVVRYCFEIAPEVKLASLKLAVECPEVWNIAINGVPISFEAGNKFRDPRILMIPIGDHAQVGTNIVTLVGKPFSVRQEIDQIYVLGDFSCQAGEIGFRIVPPIPLSWGAWKSLGMPFYDGMVSYKIRLPIETKELIFSREEFGGALIIVTQHGKELGRMWEAPWKICLPELTGESMELLVVGLPKNLFGPWHDPRHRWGLGSPTMWIGENIPTTPQAGEKYALLELGLSAPPKAGV